MTTPQPARDQLFYRVHGVWVSLFCENVEVRDIIADSMEAYRADPEGAEAEVEIDIREGDRLYPVPLHARLMVHYHDLRIYVLHGRYYFTDYFSTLTVEPGGAGVHGNVSPASIRGGGIDFFTNAIFPVAMFEALRHHGLYYAHAAALMDDEDKSYLITGNGGSGKTSLTLSLIGAGLKFLSDDTVFLRLKGEDDVEVLGFARQFHIPADLIESNPDFAGMKDLPAYRSHPGKKILKPDEWFADQRLDSFANPDYLVFPEIDGDGSRVRPLGKNETLSELLRQSPAVMFDKSLAPAHLEALRRVIRHGSGLRLFHGPELKGNGKGILELLKSHRDGVNR